MRRDRAREAEAISRGGSLAARNCSTILTNRGPHFDSIARRVRIASEPIILNARICWPSLSRKGTLTALAPGSKALSEIQNPWSQTSAIALFTFEAISELFSG